MLLEIGRKSRLVLEFHALCARLLFVHFWFFERWEAYSFAQGNRLLLW